MSNPAHFSLRLPRDLLALVHEACWHERCSTNHLVVKALWTYVGRGDQADALPKRAIRAPYPRSKEKEG